MTVDNNPLPGLTLQAILVDDDPLVLRALKRILSQARWSLPNDTIAQLNVTDFDSPIEALEYLENNSVDVIISDQVMPQIRGLHFLKRANALQPDCVAILLTGEYDLSVAIEAVNSGNVFRYISKPWQNEHLLEMVQLALEHRYERVQKRKAQQTQAQRQSELEQRVVHLQTAIQAHHKTLQEQRQVLDTLTQEHQITVDKTMELMFALLELGDKTLLTHTQRTTLRIYHFVEYLKLSVDCRGLLTQAANLHLLGLLNAPPEMFAKGVADFDINEQALWSFHPLLTQQVLSKMPALDETGEIIVQYLNPYTADDGGWNVERLRDAKRPLSEEQLRLCAHILAICSAFEREFLRMELEGVVLSAKLYEGALFAVRAQMGTLYHPELTHLFTSYIEVAQQRERQEICLPTVMDLHIGMVLSRPLEAPGGIPMIASGTAITNELIERLIFFEDTFDEWIKNIYVWA